MELLEVIKLRNDRVWIESALHQGDKSLCAKNAGVSNQVVTRWLQGKINKSAVGKYLERKAKNRLEELDTCEQL